ncbi:coenzyme Q biosynthesis protein Coq4-domain-containing protein [Terfezia claveryi]|nr:coenzyme Q biosynthesis protein Coq4-domain-containing protein [Terfezia claveryi]
MNHLRGPLARGLLPLLRPPPPPIAPVAPPAPSPPRRPFSVLSRPPPSYPGHIPINSFEKTFLAFTSLLGSFLNPRRGDLIALAGETTSTPYFLPRLLRTMQSHPTGRAILRHRPEITPTSIPPVATLLTYPPTTLGFTYAKWLETHHLSPFTRPPVRYVPTSELAYVLLRYRQSHDFYHAITGLPAIREGEVPLKLFEFMNLGLPMTGLAAASYVTLKKAERERVWDIYFPWAIKAGLECESLINVWWERELESDVGGLRARLGLVIPPDMRALRKAEKRREREKNKEIGDAMKMDAAPAPAPTSTTP